MTHLFKYTGQFVFISSLLLLLSLTACYCLLFICVYRLSKLLKKISCGKQRSEPEGFPGRSFGKRRADDVSWNILKKKSEITAGCM